MKFSCYYFVRSTHFYQPYNVYLLGELAGVQWSCWAGRLQWLARSNFLFVKSGVVVKMLGCIAMQCAYLQMLHCRLPINPARLGISAGAGCLNKVVNHRTSRSRDEVNSWCVSAGRVPEWWWWMRSCCGQNIMPRLQLSYCIAMDAFHASTSVSGFAIWHPFASTFRATIFILTLVYTANKLLKFWEED